MTPHHPHTAASANAATVAGATWGRTPTETGALKVTGPTSCCRGERRRRRGERGLPFLLLRVELRSAGRVRQTGATLLLSSRLKVCDVTSIIMHSARTSSQPAIITVAAPTPSEERGEQSRAEQQQQANTTEGALPPHHNAHCWATYNHQGWQCCSLKSTAHHAARTRSDRANVVFKRVKVHLRRLYIGLVVNHFSAQPRGAHSTPQTLLSSNKLGLHHGLATDASDWGDIIAIIETQSLW